MHKETMARLQILGENLRQTFSHSNREVHDGELLVTIVYRHENDNREPAVKAYAQPVAADDFEAILQRTDTAFGYGSHAPLPEQVEAVTDALVASVEAGEVTSLTHVQVLWAACRGHDSLRCIEKLCSLIREHDRASITLVLDEVDQEADFLVGRDVPWSRNHKPHH